MAADPLVFTYETDDGLIEAIPLGAMRRLWVDRDSTGLVWVERDARNREHESVVVSRPSGPDDIREMEQMMQDLLADPVFEILENPCLDFEHPCLILEFRYPSPHAVYLGIAS